jgi:hypothetical protein
MGRLRGAILEASRMCGGGERMNPVMLGAALLAITDDASEGRR